MELLPEREFPATVDFISPVLDPGGDIFAVRLVVNNPGEALKPGMKADVSFPPAGRESTSLTGGEAGAR